MVAVSSKNKRFLSLAYAIPFFFSLITFSPPFCALASLSTRLLPSAYSRSLYLHLHPPPPTSPPRLTLFPTPPLFRSSSRGVKMILRTVSNNPRTTRRDLMNDLQRAGPKVTKATISNTLCREGLKSCSARRVPLLKPVHVQARLKFAV